MYIAGIALRQHRKWKDTVVSQLERVTIEADEPVPYQLDGDPGGYLPLEIRVAPRRLRVLVSPKWLQSNLAPIPPVEKISKGL
jgi:diacylglycerol kinase family enzyme